MLEALANVRRTHTPGPWRTKAGRLIVADCGIMNNDRLIAQIGLSEDDAPLIAEAPALLDSCIELVEANAALLRVIAKAIALTGVPFDAEAGTELAAAGVADGFGKRAIDLIHKATGTEQT